MTNEDIAVKFEAHDHEIKSLKHRMDRNENQINAMNSLAISVEKLALSVESLMKEQQKHGERIQKMEDEPKESLKAAKTTFWNTVISVATGAFVMGAVMLIAQNIK